MTAAIPFMRFRNQPFFAISFLDLRWISNSVPYTYFWPIQWGSDLWGTNLWGILLGIYQKFLENCPTNRVFGLMKKVVKKGSMITFTVHFWIYCRIQDLIPKIPKNTENTEYRKIPNTENTEYRKYPKIPNTENTQNTENTEFFFSKKSFDS